MSTKLKNNNINVRPEFEDLFSFEDKASELEHRAEMISFRILSEVEKVCDDRKINRTDLANAVGTSKSYITQLFSGAKQVNTSIMAKFEDALDINFDIKAMLAGESHYDLLAKDMTKEKLTKLKLKNRDFTCWFFMLDKCDDNSSKLVEEMKADVNNRYKQVG